MGERFLSVTEKINGAIANIVLKMLHWKQDEYYTKNDVLWRMI